MGIATATGQRQVVERKGLCVEVTCAECGDRWEVSERRERAVRAEGTVPICPDCRRRPRPRPGPADYRFWTDRFSMDEIRLLAAALFGPWE
jgi:NAD-dependent SIR2 family protein deacetylase